jgi:hypothetical protein
MPDWGVIRGPSFSLKDVRVAKWNGDGTWGAALRVPSASIAGVKLRTVNGQLQGDGGITDAAAEAIAADAKLKFGGGNLSLYNTITNYAKTLTGVTPNRVDRMKFTKKSFPYFGLCGRMNSSDGQGDQHLFLPKLKLMDGFELNYQFGQYVEPELSILALPDDLYNIAGVSEVQSVVLTGAPTGGTFTLSFQGATTGPIVFGATAAQVITALLALSTIGATNVSGTGGPLPSTPVVVTFIGTLAAQSLPQMTGNGALLTGGTTPTVAVTTTTEGAEAEPDIFELITHETAAPVQIPPL